MNTKEREVMQQALEALEGAGKSDDYRNYADESGAIAALRKALAENVACSLNVSKVARILSDRNADVCGVDREDNWKIYYSEFIQDALAVLEAL